ncbi:MAG: sensor domain-containing diguanylate cyclase [Thiohalobacteraceae bacterium]
MKVPQHTLRITLGLATLTLGLLMLGQFIGLLPDERANAFKARQQLCETLAMQVSVLPVETSLPAIETLMQGLVTRYPEIRSSGLRRNDGTLLLATSAHDRLWPPAAQPSSEHVAVPIYAQAGRWGTLELSFMPLAATGMLGVLRNPFVHFLLFMAVGGGFSYYLFIRRALKHLDPSAVIPARVRAALDVLAEGVVLADDEGNIVLSNRSLASKLNQTPNELLGRALNSLPWLSPCKELQTDPAPFAWQTTLETGRTVTGVPMYLETPQQGMRTLMINSAPIADDAGQVRGAIITFDDVTQLEEKNVELEGMLQMLEESRDKIHRQNQELQTLAVKDPLTGCLNRRGLFERLDAAFQRARHKDGRLCCVMCDIDHFKAVNDTFGHGVGDEVIRAVAEVLHAGTRDSDTVARYGGEEFCLLLPDMSLQQGLDIAERLRRGLAGLDNEGIKVTASFGVSAMEANPRDAEEFLKQADAALYRAKRSGRNRVVAHTLPYAVAGSAAD